MTSCFIILSSMKISINSSIKEAVQTRMNDEGRKSDSFSVDEVKNDDGTSVSNRMTFHNI